MTSRDLVIEVIYLASSVLFILGLKGLSHPDRARQGMQHAALGMVLAIVGTLFHHEIVRFDFIALALILGTVIGYPLGMFVPMTAMPQRIAVSHMFGALAATLVGIAEYRIHQDAMPRSTMAALGFEVLFGALTVTGSFMAFGKLQEFITGKPVTYRGQNKVNITLFGVAIVLFLFLIVRPATPMVFYGMIGLALLLGVFMVLPIGGADMPVVVSLLNSYAGLASSATGFAIQNNVLIICGALDGASGFLLSVLMSKAMNRSFGNVLFGAFGAGAPALAAGAQAKDLTVRSIAAEDAGILMAYAGQVIIVPGYGMAVAQAQHVVRELTDLLEKRGVIVKYAIHPVAGRMPGHMNVLLAEANVPYDQLYDMEDINPEFERADVALVIGANDVVNPAARSDPSSPIYGMPILDVDKAKNVIVLKRSMNPGFAGIENHLFYAPTTSMLFGDAKSSLTRLVTEVKAL
jgi:H+-translocating NAD(P) transhydrogenase subunit beta